MEGKFRGREKDLWKITQYGFYVCVCVGVHACIHTCSLRMWAYKLFGFNSSLWRALNSAKRGRITQNRVVNGFSNAGQHDASIRKLFILNEKSKKQKLGQGLSHSLDI
jgi:hypothetical protein